MKQSLSTMTSAPTDIDEGRQYVFMSSDLESSIDFENRPLSAPSSWNALVRFSKSELILPIFSIEDEGLNSYTICFSVNEEIGKMTKVMLDREELVVTLFGEQFKSKVLKLESGRAYLRLLR